LPFMDVSTITAKSISLHLLPIPSIWSILCLD
jgi:hypothetical protein